MKLTKVDESFKFSNPRAWLSSTLNDMTLNCWNDNSGGGDLKSAWFSFSEFWVELLNAKGWVVYQIEAIKKLYLVYKFQDFK